MNGKPEEDPRVYMAAERTLLAWVRTGLAFMGFGFVVARFGLFLRELEASHGSAAGLSPHGSVWFGTGLVMTGVAVNLVAALQHRKTINRLRAGSWSPENAACAGMIMAGVIGAAGVAMAGYLLVVR